MVETSELIENLALALYSDHVEATMLQPELATPFADLPEEQRQAWLDKAARMMA